MTGDSRMGLFASDKDDQKTKGNMTLNPKEYHYGLTILPHLG